MLFLRRTSWVLAGALSCCLVSPARATEWKMEPIMSSVQVIPEAQTMPEDARREFVCMALAVYQESRGEIALGQSAVAHVVKNRTASAAYPKSICGVVWQPSQFSWTTRPVGSIIPRSSEAWERAQRVALAVISGSDDTDPTDGALNFYARYIRPAWSWGADLLRIGGHIFVRR